MADDVSWSVDEDLPESVSGSGAGSFPERAATPLLPATLDGLYELVAVIGRGGMGTVFRARDLAAGREVALKLLDVRPEPAQLERFRREGQLTAALDHPGIVKVHSAGEHQGRPYLVYALVEGGRTLADVLRAGERAHALRLVVEVAHAVGHAHRQGIVHRDLKPANVLVDPADRAVVTDFGLASAVGLLRLTQTGGRLGTPHTMAPEQWRPGAGPVGATADVWALGVMLYQALTGRHPFPAATLRELEPRILNDPPDPLRLDPPAPALEAVCLRALAKRPEDRQPDAGALAAELTAALRGEAPARPARPRRALTVLGGLGAGGLAVALGLALLLRDPSPAGAVSDPTPAVVVDPQAAAALLTDAVRELAFVERAREPDQVACPDALSTAERRARVLTLVGRARELDPGQELACAELTARAQAAAEAPRPPAPVDEARRAEAAQLVEAMWRAQRSMDRPPDEVAAGFERALELDPGSASAAFFRATHRYTESDPRGALRGCAAVLRRAPLYLRPTQDGIEALASGLHSVQSGLQELLDEPGWTDTDDDRLARALLLWGQVELEGKTGRLAAAREAIDALLARDPALVPAWTLSGFLALRARDRVRAAHDLTVAREAAPTCPTLTFYEALLLASGGAPRERVLETLILAHQRGDARLQAAGAVEPEWLVRYPELAGQRGLLAEVPRRSPPRPPQPPPGGW